MHQAQYLSPERRETKAASILRTSQLLFGEPGFALAVFKPSDLVGETLG
jgi:hypothetical protein